LRAVVESKDQVITVTGGNLLETKDFQVLVERRAAAGRAYLLTGEAAVLQRIENVNQQIGALLNRLSGRADSELSGTLDRVQQVNLDYASALAQVTSLHKEAADPRAQADFFQKKMAPLYDALQGLASSIIDHELRARDEAKDRTNRMASTALTVVLVVAGIVVVSATLLAILLGRTLSRQI